MTFLLLPPYLIFAIYVIYRVLKNIETTKKKVLMFFLLVFLLYLPLGWDVMLGRAYFSYLCETQGGVHVFQTVKLGEEYWDEDGRPVFISNKGWFDNSVFKERYNFKSIDVREFSKILNVGKYTDQIIDVKNNSVLGEKTSFTYFGGWFLKYTGFVTKGTSCYAYKRIGSEFGGFYQEFLKLIFLKK